MLGNMLGDKKSIVMALLSDSRGGDDKPLSSDMGNGGERPEMKAKEAACKDFFQAATAGNWARASQAMASFVDLHDLMEDEMED
jgi:hypothetical protein